MQYRIIFKVDFKPSTPGLRTYGEKCPQHINVPDWLKKVHGELTGLLR